MNSSLFTDPVVWVCIAVLVVGLIAFFWVVRRLRSPQVSSDSAPFSSPGDDVITMPEPTLPSISFGHPDVLPRAAVSETPAVSQEVADRLETMTARLSEMQNVLMKQSASASSGAAAGSAGGVGQGFSPETIDKLLKIIGNVIQQVDILQKSLNVTK